MDFREKNTIEFLPSGHSSYEVRWKILENAQSSIHLVTFSFMKDGTTRKLFDLLKEKAKSGVKVKILYDEIVNRTTFVGRWIKELDENGIETFGYNNLYDGWSIDRSEGRPFKQLMAIVKLKLKQHFHEKYFIVDNEHLIIGGINWGDKYAFGGVSPKAWRDTDVYITGELVQDVQLQFLKDYEMQQAWKIQKETPKSRYPQFAISYLPIYKNNQNIINKYSTFFANHNNPKSINSKIKILYKAHKPYDENELNLTNFFLEKIKGAKKRILWGCHGIRPPRIYAEYLADAVKRGVRVVLITNSQKSSRTLMVSGLMGWMYWECTKYFKYLVENGIEIYEWQKQGAFHSKNLIIDDDFVSIGSYNIANGSAFHHSESNIVVQDVDFCKKVYDQFLVDLQDCKKVDSSNFKFPKMNAFYRILPERIKMIRTDLLTESIKRDIKLGNLKESPFYEFIDIS